MRKLAGLWVIGILLVGYTAHAQTVQDFNLVNVLTGNSVSLSTYPSCSGVVIIFTTNACPYDEYYRARITKLSHDYHEKVPVLLVNSNPDPTDSNDAMVKKAQQAGITIPYLADKDQTLMNALGATKSPSVYLLKNDGGKFTIVYKGAIDDNAQVEADVRHAYLKEAIDQLLAGQAIPTGEVRPVGCSIRKK
ncbi:MAG TPA: redoxin family protein [Ohtaekwangia sp.]|uniref:redoxin family protein n=1 Tax=Ohtaekwangia sp. TaxID=2066019 RepID=UPI002F945B2C